MKKITILHVFPDDKFFDGVSDFFDRLSNVKNIYALYVQNINFQYRYIKKTNKIKLYTDYEDYTSLFSSDEIDIVYFHSLPPFFYKYFKHISKDKTVIWWCWGYDIYYGYRKTKPFIPLELYKPLTKTYRDKIIKNNILKEIIKYILLPYTNYIRSRIIKRIDYFSPVIPIEYDLMLEYCKGFRAKPFMLNSSPGLGLTKMEKLSFKNHAQNIMVGNSLSWENNHLDVIDYLHKIDLEEGRKYIFPISYGNGYGGQYNIQKLAELNPNQVLWLNKFLPKEEYFNIYNSVSHAIFGIIREQAMGNIFYCLRNAVKVFLFKDSLPYKFLKNAGYIVFSIEDDLNSESIALPLTHEEAEINYNIFYKMQNNKVCRTEAELCKMTV